MHLKDITQRAKITKCTLLLLQTGIFFFDFWCFSATFSNISAISWRPVLVARSGTQDGGEKHKLLPSQMSIAIPQF